MSRGISDPAPMPEELTGSPSDLPSLQEVDQALRQLFDMVADLNTQVATLKDIMGASIGTQRRTNAAYNEVTGL